MVIYLGNSQVGVYRTIGPTLVFLMCFLCLKTIEETNEESELLHFHYQLYMNHCGDTVTCDTDTGHPEPPIDYVTPIPCCLPYPCMKSCSSKHACCPGFDSHNDSSFFFEASDGMPTTYHVNQDITTPSKAHIKTGRELQRIYTTKSAFDQHHRQSSKLAARLGETTTNANVPSPSYARCIRPQVFHRPNTYIDSKAYRIVEVCFQDNKSVDYCYGKNVSKVLTEMIPITSRRTGITYLNRFCLQCNEGDIINENLADVWEAKIVHYNIGYNRRFVFHPDELVDNIITVFTGYVNIHFVPGPRTRNLVQQCETYDIISCNKTGLWETYDKNVEKVCHNGHSLPILHRISYGHNKLRFKNIACVYCNLGDSFNMNTTLSCGYIPVTTAKSYSQSLNIKIEEITKEKEELREKQFLSNTVRAILPVPNTDVCPTGYIVLLVRTKLLLLPTSVYHINTR